MSGKSKTVLLFIEVQQTPIVLSPDHAPLATRGNSLATIENEEYCDLIGHYLGNAPPLLPNFI